MEALSVPRWGKSVSAGGSTVPIGCLPQPFTGKAFFGFSYGKLSGLKPNSLQVQKYKALLYLGSLF